MVEKFHLQIQFYDVDKNDLCEVSFWAVILFWGTVLA